MNHWFFIVFNCGAWAVAVSGSVLLIGLIAWGIVKVYSKFFEALICLFRFKKAFIDFLLSKYYRRERMDLPESEKVEFRKQLLEREKK